MPLQVGLLTARSFVRGLSSVGGGSLVVFLVATTLWFVLSSGGEGVEDWPRFLGSLYHLPTVVVGPAFVVGVVAGPLLLILGSIHLSRVRSNPPTDAVIGPGGIRVLGRDLTFDWEQIVPSRTEVVITEEPKLSIGNVLSRAQSAMNQGEELEALMDEGGSEEELALVTVGRLMTPLADGDIVTVAKADDRIEMESLEALCETVRAVDEGGPPAPRSRQGDVQILACENCSAPVRPEDAESVSCPHCGSRIPVPQPLRERVRAARRVAERRRDTQQVVRDLVSQPGADGTRRLVQLATIVAAASWVVTWVLVAVLWLAGALTLVALLLLAGTAFALTWALYFVLRLHMTSRGALRLLTLRFGARPPAREGDSHQCRTCGAPLEAGADEMVVKCVYCDADNILPLDLRRESLASEGDALDLDEVMDERRRDRKRYLSMAGATLGGTLVGVLCSIAAIVQGVMTRGG
jgi:DNA-directed RNA polymerase subunit RPC12/RpoP